MEISVNAAVERTREYGCFATTKRKDLPATVGIPAPYDFDYGQLTADLKK
jgi:hypothetical protein